MFKIKESQWFMGSAGIINTPEGVVRNTNDTGWNFYNETGSFWSWADTKYGNHLDSLGACCAFAVTIGSLEYEQCLEYIQLLRKERLINTGVLGLFYRTGLKESYHVILNGQVTIFPYAGGKGFQKAVREAHRLHSPWIKALMDRTGMDAKVLAP